MTSDDLIHPMETARKQDDKQKNVSAAGGSLLQWKPLIFMKNTAAAPATVTWTSSCYSILFISFFFLLLFASIFAGLIDLSIYSQSNEIFKIPPKLPIDCTAWEQTPTCPSIHQTRHKLANPDRSSLNHTCPSYFRWIHEDLRYWRDVGITREMLERAKTSAHFRLVILKGKVYVEKYRLSYQTRELFTMWGILQLARWYPGRLPDLELMFNCDDQPTIRSSQYVGPNAGPPPLFRYSSDGWSMDIVFPDWSFWGWPETNIKPWRRLLKGIIKEGNKKRTWMEREPFAYWKGNTHLTASRRDLIRCNLSLTNDYHARLYNQDWSKESEQGYKNSNLEDQCTHRYKIYIEGYAWSVSDKYILACDSMTLLIIPRYYDFFTRGILPLRHYWPIRDNNKCKDIKFAVEWGNNHTNEAQAIGKAASKFIEENLKMEYVYDYMFHLLNEYSKLMKFKPSVPPDAILLCPEALICPAAGKWRNFMAESLEKSPAATLAPCNLLPPYDPETLRSLIDGNRDAIKQVELWQNE